MVRTFGYILILFHACSFSTKPILIITLSSIVAHFRAKMSLSRAQNIYYAREHKLYCYIRTNKLLIFIIP